MSFFEFEPWRCMTPVMNKAFDDIESAVLQEMRSSTFLDNQCRIAREVVDSFDAYIVSGGAIALFEGNVQVCKVLGTTCKGHGIHVYTSWSP